LELIEVEKSFIWVASTIVGGSAAGKAGLAFSTFSFSGPNNSDRRENKYDTHFGEERT
jgi:hypothetical protein